MQLLHCFSKLTVWFNTLLLFTSVVCKLMSKIGQKKNPDIPGW